MLEFAVIQTDKGQALDILRHQQGASAAVFLGDDVTDEKAFRRLHGPDVGIKVGPGDTLAAYRVDEPEDVAAALTCLLEARRTWLLGGHTTPIERLTMLSNSRTVALLTPEADVVWMCHPVADSAAVFSRLLGRCERRPLRGRPAARGAAAEPALRRRHHDRRDPLGQPARHRLPLPRRRRRPNRSDPRDQRSGQGGGLVRAAPGVRPGAGTPAGRRRRAAGLRHQRADGAACARRAVGDRARRHPPNRARGRGSVERPGDPRIALWHRGSVRESGRRERPARARGESLAGLGGHATPAVAETGADEAIGADTARAGARRLRCDHGRGHHVAARGDRRRPQLGLPLLLDPRRRADRVGAGVAGVHR